MLCTTRRESLRLDTSQTLLELLLCGMKLREGVGQVFDFFVQLLLHLAQLLGREAVEVHLRVGQRLTVRKGTGR